MHKLISFYEEFHPFVSVDSRLSQAGGLFFALKGNNVDGHDYLEEIARKKCALAVIREDFEGECKIPCLRVKDPFTTLQNLAREVQAKRPAKIIAVTGSMGKTSTKEYIYFFMKQKFRTGKSLLNHNSQTGLPLTILNDLRGDEEYVVLEMGMTQKGEIGKLVEIAPPHIAVITNVAPAHFAFFESMEGIAEAKAEILSHPKTTYAVINKNISYEAILNKGNSQKIFYGCESFPSVKLPPHLLENYNGAAKVFELCGGDPKGYEFNPDKVENRGQIIQKRGVTFFNDAYNAIPPAVILSLQHMPEGKRKIAVLGEMAELGSLTEEWHLKVAKAASETVQKVILVGEKAKTIQNYWTANKGETPPLFANYAEALACLRKEALEGDVVLLKGRKGLTLWKIGEEF